MTRRRADKHFSDTVSSTSARANMQSKMANGLEEKHHVIDNNVGFSFRGEVPLSKRRMRHGVCEMTTITTALMQFKFARN